MLNDEEGIKKEVNNQNQHSNQSKNQSKESNEETTTCHDLKTNNNRFAELLNRWPSARRFG
jgi:hypothetical protein